MKITVVGCGKVGLVLARELQGEGHEVTVIDNDEKVVESVGNMLDVIGYVGNGASYSTLVSAGVGQSDLLLAVTATDEINMLCCLAAHKLGAKHTVARVRNPEYAEQLYMLKEDLGLSMSVNPEKAAAEEIARILRLPSAAHVELFAGGRAELVSFKIPAGNALDGIKLSRIPSKLSLRMLICAVDRDGKVMIPSGDSELRGGDIIYLIGSKSQLEQIFKKLDLLVDPVKSVMIAGGGHISYYLAEQLKQFGMNVKIIEKDRQLAMTLAEQLSGVTVLNADATDHEFLSEEGIDKIDAFVALMGLDEGNILSAMYAKNRKVHKVIAKVNNQALVPLVKDGNLESLVSPKIVTGSQILRFVRAMSARRPESNMLSLYKIGDGVAEASEFFVSEDIDELTGVKLSDLRIKKGILVACLVREDSIIIPHGTDVIKPGDRVLIVTVNRNLKDLGDILED